MDKKQVTINLRAHKSTIALIDQAAELAGKTRSEFIRESAQIESRKILRGLPCPVCGRGVVS